MRRVVVVVALLATVPALGQQVTAGPLVPPPVLTDHTYQMDIQGHIITDRGPFRQCDQSAPDWSGVEGYVADHEMPAVCHKQP
jgi:hypothetical protein